MDHPNHGEEENDHSWGMYMALLTAVAKLQLGGQRQRAGGGGTSRLDEG